MSFSITVRPSGHVFQAEAQETLLEAALRSGVNLNYSCNGGRCGDCKARLLQGRLGDSVFSDYKFSPEEIAQNSILLCRAHAASDLEIEASEATSVADIPRQTITTRLSKIERYAEHTLVFQLRTPRSKTLRFLAGQHVQLRLAGGQEKDLAVASCPCNGMVLHFHLPCRAGDPFADYFFNHIKHGESVAVNGPFGSFTLDEKPDRPMVMVAEDTRIASIKSLIEQAINIDTTQPIHLFWLAREGRGHYYDNYCRSWTQALDNYAYSPLYVSTAAGPAEYEQLGESIAARYPGLQRQDIYLSGSADMERVFERVFMRHGAHGHRLHVANLRDRGRNSSSNSVALR